MATPPTPDARRAWQAGQRFRRRNKPLRDMPLTIRHQDELKKWFLSGYEAAAQPVHARLPSSRLSSAGKRALWLGLSIIAGLSTAYQMIQSAQQNATRPPIGQSTAPVASVDPSAVPPRADMSLKSSAQTPITLPEGRETSHDARPGHAPPSLNLLSEEALAKLRRRPAPSTP